MPTIFSKIFKKKYKKLPAKIQKQIKERIELFVKEPFSAILENHSLSGKYKNCRSINITGDIRAIYILKNKVAVFIEIGTHSELY